MYFVLHISTVHIHLFSVHVPKNPIHRVCKLSCHLDAISPDTSLILGGDFNSIVYESLDLLHNYEYGLSPSARFGSC